MRVSIGKNGTITILDFSPVQAYKIAAKMEKNGIVFYRELAEKVKDAEARREVDFLIDQEAEHLKTFEDLLLREKKEVEDSFEEDDFVDYMNTHVFDQSKDKLDAQRIDHRHTALEEAMDMEKRSILFYEGCLANSMDEKAKKAFKEIIGEEKSHLSKFAELLRVKCINSQKGCIL